MSSDEKVTEKIAEVADEVTKNVAETTEEIAEHLSEEPKSEETAAKQESSKQEIQEDGEAKMTNAEMIAETQTQIETQQIEKTQKKKRIKWFILGGFFLLILILIITYLGIAFHYKTRFLKNTYINGVLCDEMDVVAVASILDDQNKAYSLEVYGRDPQNPEENILLGTLSATDIDYREHDSQAAANSFLEEQNPYQWVKVFSNEAYHYQTVREIKYDEEKLSQVVNQWNAWQPDQMKLAGNAYIANPTEEQDYYVAKGLKGSQLVTDEAMKVISNAIENSDTSVNLDDYDCYKGPLIDTDDRKLNQYTDTLNKWINTEITYDWHGITILIDKSVVKDWVSLRNGEPYLDEEAVSEFLIKCSEDKDAYGKERKFTTTSGEELTLPCKYGWLVDTEQEITELLPLIYRGARITREPIYSKEGYSKGENEIGASYVEIDMSNQHLYLYYEGKLELESDFVSGCMSNGCYTPEGIFGLTYKTRNAILRGANYASPVKYWMPFNKNIGMHDASWRKTYGGEIFMRGGSHGCINLPLENAKAIYEYMEKGFPVVCYYLEPLEDIIYRAKHPGEFKKEETKPEEEAAVTEEREPEVSTQGQDATTQDAATQDTTSQDTTSQETTAQDTTAQETTTQE